MKKSLLTLGLAAMALSASATLYVTGNDVTGATGQWAPATPLVVEAAGGVYTFEAQGEFKISTTQGSWNEFNGGAMTLSGNWNKSGSTATANLTNGDKNISPAFAGQKVTYKVAQDLSTISGSVQGTVEPLKVDFYLAGTMNEWNSSDPAYKFTTSDYKTYTITLENGLDANWKITNSDWSINYGQGEEGMPVVGVLYNVADGNAGDITTAISGKVTMTFNFVENGQSTILISDGGNVDPNPNPNPNPDDTDYSSWYVNVIGSFNDWKDNGLNPVDGISKHTGLAIGTGEFKVKVWNGEDVYYSTGEALPVGQWVVIPGNAEANMTIAGATAESVYTVEFNCATGAIKVTLEGEDPNPNPNPNPDDTDYSSWYVNVIGTFNDWTDNGLNPVDGISKHTGLAIGTGEFKVKVWNGEDVYYSTGEALPVGQWVVIPGNAEANMTIAGATAESVYTVEFNCATGAIKVTLEGEDPNPNPNPNPNPDDTDYSSWYVNVIGFFNDWTDNGLNPNADGLTEHTDLVIGTSEFKVKVWNGTEDLYYSTGEALPVGQWVVIPGDVEANMTIAGATEGQAFNVEFNVATGAIKVTSNSTAVEAIEAVDGEAVYFNLQGVKVANPENGIFVKVLNGKAVKVAL